MALLIDGHNLIGAGVFADIRLSDEDDEAKLVARLKIWRSRHPDQITVIFDRGIPGGRDVRMGGAGVEVVFAADPTEADDLIRRRLRRRPAGLTLVSNDEALLREATAHGVAVMRGGEFVDLMTLGLPDKEEPGTEADLRLDKAEVDEWLAIFGARRSKRTKRSKPTRPASRGGTKPPAPKSSKDRK